MATIEVKVGGVSLPTADLIALKRSDELLWSEGTGRSASTGAMAGSVVAEKQTWSLEWGPIASAQYAAIRNAVGGGFMTLSIKVDGVSAANTTVYRGGMSGSMSGVYGGVAYYSGVSVELVER